MSNFKSFLFIAGMGVSLCAYGQAKINPAGNLIVNEYKEAKLQQQKLLGKTSNDPAPCYPAIVMANDPEALKASLDSMGIAVTSDLGDILTIDLPADKAEKVAALASVKYVDFGQKVSLQMDFARPASNVSQAQEGFDHEGSQLKFDGTGVVAGMFDTGLQANHLNFKHDNGQGATRVQRLFWFRTNGGNPTTYTPANMSSFTTDDQNQSHATHVAGIMGGSYKGNSTYASVNAANGTSGQRLTGNCPYYGVATGADLAFAVGPLYQASITAGVQRIVEYAQSEGQPCVVNLSLGNTYGPHDGTDAYTQTLNRLGKKAIICIAAGNDGDVNMSIVKSLTASDSKIQTFLENNTADGSVDIWGNDSTPFKATWAVYSTATRTLTPIATVGADGERANVSSSSNSTFGAGFTGTVSMDAQLNPLNNRFNVYCNVSVQPLSTNRTNRLALIVEGTDGQKIWIYGDTSTSFASHSLVGWTSGTAENSINTACCSDGVVSVGAYTTRTTWGRLPASGGVEVYGYTGAGFTVGSIAPFSSYGTTFQGEGRPTVCAPGANIISSYNRLFVTSHAQTGVMTANARSGIATDYWGPMQGTSMACPYVSGTVALWLQANNNLEVADVLDVIEKTSEFRALQMRPKVRWGAGKIDAVAGLKYILSNASVGQVWDDNDQRLLIAQLGSELGVTLAGESEFTVAVADLQGRIVAQGRGTDGTATVDTGSLAGGVYIVNVAGHSFATSRKITLR